MDHAATLKENLGKTASVKVGNYTTTGKIIRRYSSGVFTIEDEEGFVTFGASRIACVDVSVNPISIELKQT